MARPRHLGDHHPVHLAGDPWCRRFQEEAGEADIETAPATAALALVVERTAATADPTSLPLAAFRAHMRHQAAVGFLDQALQHAVHHTEDPQPYTATRHVVCLPRVRIEYRNRSWVGGVPPLGCCGAPPLRRDREGGPLRYQLVPAATKGTPSPARGGASLRAEQAAERP